ncbi:MAG: hypothetical protein JNM07_14025 [Phycisphaerae bacterium]|nr:hypothetical protein [Phycisphaerae bacterium]
MNDRAIELGGAWLLRHDPADEGAGARWWAAPPTRAGAGWTTTDVPGPWQRTLGPAANGVAWYARRVPLPEAWRAVDPERERVWLEFESVATDCRAWVNGVSCGGHVGDYLPFRLDATEALAGAAIADVVVRVDQMHAPRPRPGVLTENGHITKGFHDVLSIQHAGIWQPARLVRTGRVSLTPDGLAAFGDPASGGFRVVAEFAESAAPGRLEVRISDPDGAVVWSGAERIGVGAERIGVSGTVPGARAWWPESPALYRCEAVVRDDRGAVSEIVSVRFGFRSARVGGPGNGRLLLNGRPVQLRGVLHWGHEPRHMSPAPTADEIRGQFTRLRAMGFNAVCLCMWYPPRAFFDIADETGMLLWQEHPVWKSAMQERHLPEYRRILRGCFRRDRGRASVVVVSGSCEHEGIHPDLARWWWETAAAELPGIVKQVQTAFVAWTNPAQTDLHDEHVYDNSGRWVSFLEDFQEQARALPPRPLAMGETILFSSWPDLAALEAATAGAAEPRPWWFTRGFDECRRLETEIATRWGRATLARFRAQADRQHLLGRKFQVETLRRVPTMGAWVTNHIRDVPACRCGFMDDLDRWRFEPDATRGWLGDVALLLRTPEDRRGFAAGGTIACAIGAANHGTAPLEGPVTFEVEGGRASGAPRLRVEVGDVAFAAFSITLPMVPVATRVRVRASVGSVRNEWDLWALPVPEAAPADVVRLDGLPIQDADRAPEWEERCYSSGWGLKVRSWRLEVPDLSRVLFKCPLWRFDGAMPAGTRVVLAHALTRRLIRFMADEGGRVVLLAGRNPGGLGPRPVVLYAQVPLVIESGSVGGSAALDPGESDAVVDLLHHDLTRRCTRALPTEEWGIASRVEPVVRLCFTHDTGAPRIHDAVFEAGVGAGVLIVSSLDHTEDAGRWLLARLLARAGSAAPAAAERRLDPHWLEERAANEGVPASTGTPAARRG